MKEKKIKLVGSMTTLPGRIKNIIKPIKHIIRQTLPLDILYINMPLKTLKGQSYKLPKDFMSNFTGFHTKVILNRCKEDYGPITKIAPVIDIETDPETYIISFDDDIVVHKDVVKILHEKILQYPNTCLGFSGLCIGQFPFYAQIAIENNQDVLVDWIQGVHVVAYKRSFFDNTKNLVTYGDDTPIKDFLVTNDDHRISGYLSQKNIPRMSIGYNVKDYLFPYFPGQPDALSGRHGKFFKEHKEIIKYFSNKGLYYRYYRSTRSLIFLILLPIIISMIFYYNIPCNNTTLKIILTIMVLVIISYKLIRHFAPKTLSPLQTI